MNILYISRRFYSDIVGGGEISALYLAKATRAQKNKVFVCSFTDKKNHELQIDGIKIFKLRIPKLKFSRLSNLDYMYFQMAKFSSDIIKKVTPDIIHLLNFESVPLSAIYYKKKFKVPIIATVNGPLFGCFTGLGIDYKGDTCTSCRLFKRYLCAIDKWGFKGNLFYIYSNWYMNMLKISYKFVDKFLIVSKAMQPLLLNMGIPKKKMTLLYNPIYIRKEVKTNLKKKLKIESKKVILYAGRLSPNKGIENTIKALVYLDNVVFLVLGNKRGYYEYLTKLAKELKVSDKIRFMGYVEHSNIKEYYSIGDVVVLVGKFYEPLSRMLLEACSYGVPCVVSNSGGNNEIIDDGKNGIVVKTFETEEVVSAIKRILNNPKMAKKMSEHGIIKAEKEFSIEVIGKKLTEVYKICQN